MAQCHWCDKSLPGNAIPACGSCLLRPPPQSSEPEVEKPAELDADHDISYLSNKAPSRTPKSAFKVMSEVREASKEQPVVLQETLIMKTLKVKSNSLRGRLFPIGHLMLHFDEHGIAEFPEAELAVVKAHMRLRPGRFTLLEEPTSAVPAFEEKLSKTREALKELTRLSEEAGLYEELEEESSVPAVEDKPVEESVEKPKPSRKSSARKKKTSE